MTIKTGTLLLLADVVGKQPPSERRKLLVEMEGSVAVQRNPKVIVSHDDSDLLMWRQWRINAAGYARLRVNSISCDFALHRVIMGRSLGRKLGHQEYCDHINGCRSDNRRENLRIVSAAGNAQNRSNHPFRGTTWHRQSKKWQASVGHQGRSLYLGLFSNRAKAAEAAHAKRQSLGFLNATRPSGTKE